MMQMNLDIAALRTLVIGMELGSFAKAADRVGRSTSAVSAQIKKLEEQAGASLFRKSGRGLALTDAGEIMLGYAQRLIDLNDEATVATRGIDLEGWIRLGLQEDFGEAMLPDLLGRFARAHPKVRIEARVAGNTDLRQRIDAGQLDLALVWGNASAIPRQRDDISSDISSELIATPGMRWIGSAALPWRAGTGEPLPLIAFDRPCLFSSAASAALDQAGIPWRIVFTSPSLAGLWAAAAAGLGLTVRTRYGLPASLDALDEALLGLPPLPTLPLILLRGSSEARPLVERLAAIMLESVRGQTSLLDQERRTRIQLAA